MKHNKYFKTQLALCAALAVISSYNPPPRDCFLPRGSSFRSFVIACQRRKNHK